MECWTQFVPRGWVQIAGAALTLKPNARVQGFHFVSGEFQKTSASSPFFLCGEGGLVPPGAYHDPVSLGWAQRLVLWQQKQRISYDYKHLQKHQTHVRSR